MSNSVRDSQFSNFAHTLYMECMEIYQDALIKGYIDADQRVIRNIARRAYDLVIEVAKRSIDGNSCDEERDAKHIVENTADLIEGSKRK